MAIPREQWEQVLELVKRQRQSTYRILTLKLDAARTEQVFNITGSLIWMLDATDMTSKISIRLNDVENDQFSFSGKQKGLRGVFHRFFITNTAQAGKEVTLAIATQISDFFEPLDTSSQTDILTTLEAIRDELKGTTTALGWNRTAVTAAVVLVPSNANRKSFGIQNDPTNTKDLLLGLDNTLSTAKYMRRLTPGASWNGDDYRGDIYAMSDDGIATVQALWNHIG